MITFTWHFSYLHYCLAVLLKHALPTSTVHMLISECNSVAGCMFLCQLAAINNGTYPIAKVLLVSVPALIRAAIASSIPPRKTVWGTAYLQLVTVEFNFCVAEALLTT